MWMFVFFSVLRIRVLTVLATILVCGLGLVWILGKNALPWLTTVRTSARESLEELVNKEKYELAKAQIGVEEARRKVIKNREAMSKCESGIRSVDSELKITRSDQTQLEKQLALLKRRIDLKKPVRTVNQEELPPEQVELLLQDYTQRIELAKGKVAFLETMLNQRLERRDKLAHLYAEAPMQLARLEMSLRHLAGKVQFYEEHLTLVQDERSEELSLGGFFAEAQKTLAQAHTEIDAKLARFDALLDTSVDTHLVLDQEEPESGNQPTPSGKTVSRK
jgi:hypothetical protein